MVTDQTPPVFLVMQFVIVFQLTAKERFCVVLVLL
jgi:hypothetical protein